MTIPFINRSARVRGAKFALAALGLALAGCQAALVEPVAPSDAGLPPPPEAEVAAVAPPEAEVAAVTPAEAEVAAVAPAEDIAAPALEPAVEPAGTSATPKPLEITATPSDLFGLDEAGITALLGPAHYTRNEPPARVLQYAGLTCVLDLFLYPEGPDGTMATVYFEMRPIGDAPAPSGCFAGLVLAAGGY